MSSVEDVVKLALDDTILLMSERVKLLKDSIVRGKESTCQKTSIHEYNQT